MRATLFVAIGLICLAALPARAEVFGVTAPKAPSFEDNVMPVLQAHCLACHQPGGAGFEKSGLDLRSYEGLMAGTKHGSIIKPGDASLSNLMRMIEGQVDAAIRMPHNGKKIDKIDRNIIRRWINQGANNN